MDENHQDKTESKLTPTEDKSTPASLPLPDQRGTDQLQKNHMEETIEQFRDRRYQVTEEYSNTGQRSKVSGEHPQRKTLWDWLQLLVIPLLIIFLGIGFTWGQHQTSLQIAKDAQEEATLKAYLDAITTLFDNKPGSQSVADMVVRADAVVARAKTLTALRRLTDPRLKAIVVQFLYEAHLIGYYPCDDTCPVAPAVIDLSGADLTGADLTDVHLSGADLTGANLSGANLSFAYLYGADLSSVDLIDADLYGATLSFASLDGAYLSGANLSFAYLSGATLSGANLSDVNLSFAHMYGANLINTNLSGATLSGAYMSFDRLDDANLSNANLSSAYMSGAYMSFDRLDGATLSNATLSNATLSGAQHLTQQQLDQVHSCRDATLPQGLACHHNQ